jgi:hypothetical protein
LFPLLTRNDILVYPNPHHGLLWREVDKQWR